MLYFCNLIHVDTIKLFLPTTSCRSVIIPRSKILGFILEKVWVSKTMAFVRPLPGTTNECQTLGFHSENRSSVLEEHHQECIPLVLSPPLDKVADASCQISDTQGDHMSHFLHRNHYPLRHYQPPIAATMSFSASASFMKMYIKTCPITPIKKAKLRASPK